MSPYNERIAHLYPDAVEVEGCLVLEKDDERPGYVGRVRQCVTHLGWHAVGEPVPPWVPCPGLREWR